MGSIYYRLLPCAGPVDGFIECGSGAFDRRSADHRLDNKDLRKNNITISKRLAGTLAIFAALLALAITLPFAAAYFRAYGSGQTIPALTKAFGHAYPSLLNFDRAEWVYQIYGRLYSLVIPLTIPAMLRLKAQIGSDSRGSLWGWRIFFGGVVMFGVGVFGDYWPDPNSYVVGAGFLFEMIGSLVIWVGAVLYGITVLKGDFVPRWIGFGLVGIAPLGIIGLLVTGHIPAGPLFGYVLFWLAFGSLSVWNGNK